MNKTPTAGRLGAGDWLKSSYSAANNECVEVRLSGPAVAVRDSKAPSHGVLSVPRLAFMAFVEELKQ